MATPRTPNSPPDDPGDDDEISLDEADERTQQRPRLPDQRREKKQFEMAAPAVSARESEETRPAPSFGENELADPDEIETYDPVALSQDPAGRRESNAPAETARVTMVPTEGLDDLEEFIARTVTQAPDEEKKKVRRPLTMIEKVCFGSGMLILLSLTVWLVRAVASESNGIGETSRPRPKLPMEGSLITIKEAAANWRFRNDKDRVAEMEVIMPIPGHQMPELIPQTTFTVDTGAGKTGFLRFIYRDSYGKPRGDTRVVHVDGGSLKDMGKSEVIKSSSEGAVYCSEGMQNLQAYHSYEADNVPRWSVEIAESANYGASDKDWKVLGTFNVRNELVK